MSVTTPVPPPANGSAVKPEQTIDGFVSAVRAGCESWETAGQILVALVERDPDAIKRINKQHPFLSIDALECFYSIGQRTLYPMVLLLPRHVVFQARLLPYEKQKALCTEPVELVSRISGDKPVLIRKSAAELTKREVSRVMDNGKIIPTEKQVAKLHKTKPVTFNDVFGSKEAPPQRTPRVVGRFAVRRGVGGTIIFEKTASTAAFAQRILLDDGQALIELTEYDNS